MNKLRAVERALDAIERRVKPTPELPELPEPEIIIREDGSQVHRSWWLRDGELMRLDVVCPPESNVDLSRM